MLLRKKVLGTVGYLGGLPATLEAFTWAWGQLIQFNREYVTGPAAIVHYARARASLHWFARNSLVEQMQGDWLLQLDTDHAPPPDLLMRMLDVVNANGIDVATALYRHKNAHGGPVIYQWDAETGKLAQPISDWDRSVSAFGIGSAGGGALFVRRSVFEKVEQAFGKGPFNMLENYGEDHAFFQRLKRLGIPAYALANIESPHLMVTPLTMDTYTPIPMSVESRVPVGGFI